MENITTFAFNKQESGNATYNILMTLPLYTTGPYDLNMKRNILSITIRQTLADAPYQPPYRVFLAPDYQGLHIRKTMALGDSNPCPKTTVNFLPEKHTPTEKQRFFTETAPCLPTTYSSHCRA